MNKNDYIEKCRLSMENFLILEKQYFKLADAVYIWDDWDNKKDSRSLVLANLLNNICIGVEDSLKLLFQNPLNDLNANMIQFLKEKSSYRKRYKELLKELKSKKYEKLGLVNMLDYDNFRMKLNEIAKIVIYIKPPFEVAFERVFNNSGKPIWFKNYEDVKHNLFTNYKKAKFDIVFDSLVVYYILCKILSHESSYIETKSSKYFSWYDGEFKIFKALYLTDSNNRLFCFKSEYFNNIKCENGK